VVFPAIHYFMMTEADLKCNFDSHLAANAFLHSFVP